VQFAKNIGTQQSTSDSCLFDISLMCFYVQGGPENLYIFSTSYLWKHLRQNDAVFTTTFRYDVGIRIRMPFLTLWLNILRKLA